MLRKLLGAAVSETAVTSSVVTVLSKKKEKEDTKKDKAKEVSEEVLLLREIRDSLKK